MDEERKLDTAWALAWFEHAARMVSARRLELIELDRAIGDGDHGENMDRGFNAAAKEIGKADLATPGDVWTRVAQACMMHIGGTSGPLLAMAFTSVGTALARTPASSVADLAQAITAGSEALARLGKAQVGDKTMYDTWAGAADALQGADPGNSTAAALEAMALGVREAAASTEPMIARRGRASYLGERSIGTVDPGALSSAYILASAYTAYADIDPEVWWQEPRAVLAGEKEN